MIYDYIISELGNAVGEGIMHQLTESSAAPVVVYVGRFQPFHKGHAEVYKYLVNKFGKNNVFIGSSNRTDDEKSPFKFAEKKRIMQTMFGIPASQIVQIKNPYEPVEVLNRFPDNTPYIAAVGDKDAERLKGKYFRPLDSAPSIGYKDAGYVMKVPMQAGGLSGTEVRATLGSPTVPINKKKQLFTQLYGKFDPSIFKLVTSTIGKLHKQGADLDKKIKNPDTGRNIKIKSALHYSPEKTVRKAAERLVASETVGVGGDLSSTPGYIYQGCDGDCDSQRKFLDSFDENILLEGGAAGHMMHPFDDPNIKFADLKDIVSAGLEGSLSGANEKTDGQNISFTIKNGKVRFARNKGHVKNNGEAALTADELKEKFFGRGELSDSFSAAADDIELAASKLNKDVLNNLFGEGKRFMNVEIINPKTKNVIPYSQAILQFHGTIEFDTNGNLVGSNPKAGKLFSNEIRKVGAEQQKTYKLEGPRTISFSSYDDDKLKKKAGLYTSEIENEEKKYGLSPTSTLAEYSDVKWHRLIVSISDRLGVKLQADDVSVMVRRWSRNDKSAPKPTDSPEKKKLFSYIDSHAEELRKRLLSPIESIVLSASTDIISRVTNNLAANSPEIGLHIQRKVELMISKIKQTNDTDKLKKLNQQLSRLDKAGGIKGIKPIEGIVFIHNGKTYKLTGAFAPVNQILGLMGFEGKRDEEPEKEEPSSTPTKDKEKIDPGARIENPETKNKILVKTALSYPPEHPAHKAAERKYKRQ